MVNRNGSEAVNPTAKAVNLKDEAAVKNYLRGIGLSTSPDTVCKVVDALKAGRSKYSLYTFSSPGYLCAKGTINSIECKLRAGELTPVMEWWENRDVQTIEDNPNEGDTAAPPVDDLLGKIPLEDRARAINGYLWDIRERARTLGMKVYTVRVSGAEYRPHDHAIIKNILRHDAHLSELVKQFEDARRSRDRELAVSLVDEIERAFEWWLSI
jgi:hypothetical protein